MSAGSPSRASAYQPGAVEALRRGQQQAAHLRRAAECPGRHPGRAQPHQAARDPTGDGSLHGRGGGIGQGHEVQDARHQPAAQQHVPARAGLGLAGLPGAQQQGEHGGEGRGKSREGAQVPEEDAVGGPDQPGDEPQQPRQQVGEGKEDPNGPLGGLFFDPGHHRIHARAFRG